MSIHVVQAQRNLADVVKQVVTTHLLCIFVGWVVSNSDKDHRNHVRSKQKPLGSEPQNPIQSDPESDLPLKHSQLKHWSSIPCQRRERRHVSKDGRNPKYDPVDKWMSGQDEGMGWENGNPFLIPSA